MNTRILIAVVVSMFVCQQVHDQEDGEPEQAEATELEGIWEIVSAISDGQDIGCVGERVRFCGARVIFFWGSDADKVEIPIGTLFLDRSAMPAHIDINYNELVGEGPRHSQGIYDFDEDTLIICISHANGPDRPNVFESTDDNGWILKTYRRVAEEEDNE